MISVISRIALRYAAGAMVAAGYLDDNIGHQIGADPDLLLIVGTAVGCAVELTYAVAKRLGWKT